MFTAPVKGIYSFLATVKHRSPKLGNLKLLVNNKTMASSTRSAALPDYDDQNNLDETRRMAKPGKIWLLATLELNDKDKVRIKLNGEFYELDKPATAYFEGRLITKINE